jgi:hypothetical protein
MIMPPPRAGKQPNGDEEEQKAEGQFAALENQNQQNDPDQRGSAGGQIMGAEVAKKIFDFIEVHNLNLPVFQESKIERCEHQDNTDVHHQPFPEPMLKE